MKTTITARAASRQGILNACDRLILDIRPSVEQAYLDLEAEQQVFLSTPWWRQTMYRSPKDDYFNPLYQVINRGNDDIDRAMVIKATVNSAGFTDYQFPESDISPLHPPQKQAVS